MKQFKKAKYVEIRIREELLFFLFFLDRIREDYEPFISIASLS